MYEIKLPLFALLFFKFHSLKLKKFKNFDFLNQKYNFEFLALSYLKNMQYDSYYEIKTIFPELISSENGENAIIGSELKMIGVFTYTFSNNHLRLVILIQEDNKFLNFRVKMKRKTQLDFYESILDKTEIINDIKNNIIEEIFSSFIVI